MGDTGAIRTDTRSQQQRPALLPRHGTPSDTCVTKKCYVWISVMCKVCYVPHSIGNHLQRPHSAESLKNLPRSAGNIHWKPPEMSAFCRKPLYLALPETRIPKLLGVVRHTCLSHNTKSVELRDLILVIRSVTLLWIRRGTVPSQRTSCEHLSTSRPPLVRLEQCSFQIE